MNFDRYFDSPALAGIAKAERNGEASAHPREDAPITGLPEGRWLDDGVYATERSYAIGGRYGSCELASPDGMDAMRLFGSTGRTAFIDLETTGLAGGTGTYAFMCGIGYVSGSDFKVVQLFLEGPANEPAWLAAIGSFIPEGACVVTYNGQTFDLPLLRTRHVLARSVPVWENMPHIDLLHYTRRLYRGILDSCSLGSVERHILGVRRSGMDIPGYLIPGLYAQYLKSRDASPLGGVFYHNELDIVSLAAMFCKVARVLEGDCSNGHELLRAGDIWQSVGEREKGVSFWERACEIDGSRIEGLVRMGYHAKKNMDFTSAGDYFYKALDAICNPRSGTPRGGGFVSPYLLHEELAKLEEHRFQRMERAMRHTDSALEWLKCNRYLLGRNFIRLQREMMHRRLRLERKLNAKGKDAR